MADWDSLYRKQGVIQKKPEEFIESNIKVLKENKVKRILDLGCGTGRNMAMLLDAGFEVHGLDASPTAIEILTEVLRKRKARGLELKVGEFTNIEWPKDFFDAVVCVNVIQHGRMHDIGKAAAEIHRVTRKGGVLLLRTLSTSDGAHGMGEEIEENTFITGVPPDGDIPHHFFTKEELTDLFRGFEIISLKEKVAKPNLRPIEKSIRWELAGRRK